MRKLACLIGFFYLGSGMWSQAQEVKPPTEIKAQRDARMAWWREARFGLFIHWGIYSVPAGEWKGKPVWGGGEWILNCGEIPVADYRALAPQFNPTKFDAKAWVALAKAAGMKYIVITAKHHDGFAMFKSQDPFNIVDATPFKRDVLQELAAACRQQNIKLGFYYSQSQDWTHPGGAAWPVNGRAKDHPHWDPAQDGDYDAYLEQVAVPQVRELLTNYGKDIPAVLWWDTPRDMTPARGAKLAAVVNALRPDLIMNNRGGGGIRGDTETPEQHIPPQGYPGKDWETCMTMNGTWGYKKDDQQWKSSETLIRNLCDIASKGGNYLLNVGPTAEGIIPPPSVETLQVIGRWLKVNGEAIYGTGPTAFGEECGAYSETEKDNKGKPKFINAWAWRCTTKPGRLFVHLFQRPPEGSLLLPGLQSKVTKAYWLADTSRQPLTATLSPAGVSVRLPEKLSDPVATVLVVELDEPIARVVTPKKSGKSSEGSGTGGPETGHP